MVELNWAIDGAHGNLYGQSLIMYIWYNLHTSPQVNVNFTKLGLLIQKLNINILK
jgi:hypothetical protein